MTKDTAVRRVALARTREAIAAAVTVRGGAALLDGRYMGEPTTRKEVCGYLRRDANWGARRERHALSQLGTWLRREERPPGKRRGPTSEVLLWHAETVLRGMGSTKPVTMKALRAVDPLAALAMLLVAHAPCRGELPDLSDLRAWERAPAP